MKSRLPKLALLALIVLPLATGSRGCNDSTNTDLRLQGCLAQCDPHQIDNEVCRLRCYNQAQ